MATGHWQAMCQPCIRGALCSCSTRQSRRDPPGFAAAAAPAAQSCPLCPQLLLCRSAGPGVPGGGCRASRTPADACTCRGCCAKRFPASCSAVLAPAVPLPPSGRRRPPSCGRPRAGCDTQAAAQGRSAEKRARLRGSLKGSPRARVLLRRWPLKPFFPPFSWEGFTVQREVLRAPVAEAEEQQLVLPSLPRSSESDVPAWERSSRLPNHILQEAGAGTLLGRHGVLLKPLQMEQTSPGLKCRCGSFPGTTVSPNRGRSSQLGSRSSLSPRAWRVPSL